MPAAPQISRLDDGVARFVRATSILKSVSSVAKEMIWNSLDAKARTVDIFIDFATFAVEIRDDGLGMCLDKVGKWNESSKEEREGSYGYRGQALSAVVELAEEVCIVSRQQGCPSAYMKRLVKREVDTDVSEVDPTKNYCGIHGTIINIKNLFYNVPVRQKSTRASVEISSIKEFIQQMGILHHAVSWTLVDVSSNRTLCTMRGEVSVGSRFESIHSREALNKMRSVRASYDGFAIEGLLSPPIPAACHWNRDCQYIFLNGRHCKSSDANFSLLASAFGLSVSSSGDGRGPAPKHNQPSATRTGVHPGFVLQIMCPLDAYDVACEPDKSVAVFTTAGRLRLWRCLALLIRSSFQEFRPDLIGALEQHISAGEQALSGLAAPRRRVAAEAAVPSSSNPNPSRDGGGDPFLLREERPDALPNNPFRLLSAGGGSGSASPSLAHMSPQSRFFHKAFSSSAPSSAGPKAAAPVNEDSGSGSGSGAFHSAFGVEVRRVLIFEEMTATAPTVIADHSHAMIAPMATFNAFDAFDTAAADAADTSCLAMGPAGRGADATVSLSRATIPQLQVVGQLNRSYVLAVSAEGCLFAIDQHAADERSLLEAYGAQLLPHKYGSVPAPRIFDHSYLQALPSEEAEGERDVDATTAGALRDRRALFRSWKFEYEVKERAGGLAQPQCSVQLLCAPLVHGELLTVDDLVEFAYCASRDIDGCLSLQQPPCVQRILSSHACRAAKKFGEVLSTEECRALLLRLAETSFPFQCAHGRPTVYPIVNLKYSENGNRDKITYDNLCSRSWE